jgi:hypothetical protein
MYERFDKPSCLHLQNRRHREAMVPINSGAYVRTSCVTLFLFLFLNFSFSDKHGKIKTIHHCFKNFSVPRLPDLQKIPLLWVCLRAMGWRHVYDQSVPNTYHLFPLPKDRAIGNDSIGAAKTNSSFHRIQRNFLTCLYKILLRSRKEQGRSPHWIPLYL